MPIPRQLLTECALASYKQAAPVQLKRVSFIRRYTLIPNPAPPALLNQLSCLSL